MLLFPAAVEIALGWVNVQSSRSELCHYWMKFRHLLGVISSWKRRGEGSTRWTWSPLALPVCFVPVIILLRSEDLTGVEMDWNSIQKTDTEVKVSKNQSHWNLNILMAWGTTQSQHLVMHHWSKKRHGEFRPMEPWVVLKSYCAMPGEHWITKRAYI